MITGEQIRRGRELYRLAPRAGMGHTLLAQFENCVRPLDEESASRLRAALEAEGVEFLLNGSGGAVRLRAHNGPSVEVTTLLKAVKGEKPK